MIRRILFALVATASIPAILASSHASAQTASGPTHGTNAISGEIMLMPHISVQKIGKGSPVILIPGFPARARPGTVSRPNWPRRTRCISFRSTASAATIRAPISSPAC
jgi:hypothetical protein